MSATIGICAPTAEAYRAAFVTEQGCAYPTVDAYELASGYALDRTRLEAAAQVLACPLKKSPPNWQHGRVLYATARQYLHGQPSGYWNVLDIGTAKGFSALCLQWALNDHADGAITYGVTSVDVIDPQARVARNTVAEVDGLLTLSETLRPWPAAKYIRFEQSTGLDWLLTHPAPHFAFVDGTHDATVVAQEAQLLAARQGPGDLAIFDDVHRPDIRRAVESVSDAYQFTVLEVLPTRHYAIGVRR